VSIRRPDGCGAVMPLIKWVICVNAAFVAVFAYISPTVAKAVGMHLSVTTIAGLGLAGTALSMSQAPIARWVPAKYILYGGVTMGIPQGILILWFSSANIVAAVILLKLSWMVSNVISGNWSALQNEALAKVGRLSQLQTLLGSACSAAALVGAGLVFLWPPSLHTSIIIAGVTELIGTPVSYVTAKKILEQIEETN